MIYLLEIKFNKMKKIFFILAFIFIGQQAFSQMYMVTVSDIDGDHPEFGNCNNEYDNIMTIIDPQGNITYKCLPDISSDDLPSGGNNMALINQEFNSILNQGYKLVHVGYDNSYYNGRGIYLFAIPWTANGLEEVPQTIKNLNIHPNPANEFIDIILDYDIKSSSDIVIYSEAGYIYHKEKVSKLNRNEPYRLDISRVPAGRYFITIINDKTYTTAQKLIII